MESFLISGDLDGMLILLFMSYGSLEKQMFCTFFQWNVLE